MTLSAAIKSGNLSEVIRNLTETPSSINEKSDGIWLPFLAARTGNEAIVKYMVEYSRASFSETDHVRHVCLLVV